jgi:hypothetical protein
VCGRDILTDRGGATNQPRRDAWENGATNRRHQRTLCGFHNAVFKAAENVLAGTLPREMGQLGKLDKL